MKKAFTLAEVLITLAIVGIVAAITIPSVIANYQQKEFKTGLRKAVSVLNEAIQANIAVEGKTPYDRGGKLTQQRSATVNLSDYLTKHMNVIKVVQGRYLGTGASNNAFYTADGMRFEIPSSGAFNGSRSNIILHESGYKINSSGELSLCGSFGLAHNPNKTMDSPCIIFVDVNGDKKPTVYGANVGYLYPASTDKRVTDIFPILITEYRAIPFGVVAQRAMYDK